jgi:hypothetical protein
VVVAGLTFGDIVAEGVTWGVGDGRCGMGRGNVLQVDRENVISLAL